MNIHEYQAKDLLEKFGVKIPAGIMAESPAEAAAAAKKLGGDLWVVKAQVHAGGRGKAGGVKLAKSIEEVEKLADEMLGMTLVTHQTGPEGQHVAKVYITEGIDIEDELYVCMMLDRATSRICMVASSEGGVDIEEVAEKTPEAIIRTSIDPTTGLMPYQCRDVAFKLGLDASLVGQATKFLMSLYKAFTETDAEMIEINPMVITKQGELNCLDSKVSFDANALFRHKDLVELRDEEQEDAKEVRASKHDLSYISLDGSIGCMVNGAGLAMATMDIIKYYGGAPANFLDVGGSATEERVTEAFKIILSDENVEGILVNIFGGIMKCDVIARGVLAAAKEVKLSVPLVVRLAGTNVEQGKEILAGSDLPIIPASDLADAAEKVVKAVKEAKAA